MPKGIYERTEYHRIISINNLSKRKKIPKKCDKCGRLMGGKHKCPTKEEQINQINKNFTKENREKGRNTRLKRIREGKITFEYLMQPRSAETKRKISKTKKALYAVGLHKLNPLIRKGVCLNSGRTHFTSKNGGKNHWNWQGGKYKDRKTIYQSLEYNKWRKKIFIRDDFTCQICGIRNKKRVGKSIVLHAHHKKPVSTNKELIFNIDNGITLCKKCHINIHRGKKKCEKPIKKKSLKLK